jgi:signal transduction histidine kinase
VLGDLTPAARERVLSAFHFALWPDGYLWLGEGADWAGERGLFATCDDAHGLFIARAVLPRVPAPLANATGGQAAEAAALPVQTEPAMLVRTLHRQLLEPYAPPSALLTPQYEIVHLSAGAGKFLRLAEGPPSPSLLDVALPELQLALRTALDQAQRRGAIVTAPDVAFAIDGAIERVNLLVQPVQTPAWACGYLLVLFERATGDAQPPAASAQQQLADQFAEVLQDVLAQLQRATERAAIEAEQLRTANEELQISNEELRARAADLAASQAALQAEIAERQRIQFELARGTRQQAALAALSRQALAKSDLDRFLTDATAIVARTLNVEYCAVLQRLPDGQGLRVRAGFGWRAGVVGQITVGADHMSQAGYTLVFGAPLLVADLRAETRFQPPPVLLDHGVVSSLSVAIDNDHGSFGVLGAHTTQQRSFSADDVQFLQAVANLLAAAIARQWLEAARQQLLLRFDSVREEEQRQIARELHDQLGQYLTGLRLSLTLLGDAAPLPPAAAAHLERVQGIVEHIGGEVRHLVLALRPISLDEQGLLATLKNYVADWSKQAQVAVDLHSRGLDRVRLPPRLETTIYRVVQEALSIVLRHAQAHSVSLILERRADYVQVVIEDDGRGFDVTATLGSPNVEQRLGLLGMQERAAMVGGQLTIESSTGRGTSVFLRLPYVQEGPAGSHD